ncbi:reverse transcriptase domain-containing protein [Tanacetum coccineum]
MIAPPSQRKCHTKLCGLLQRNLDIFAWKPADMTGVPRHIAEHRLNIREGCSPVRQKKRGQAADRNQAIQEEVRYSRGRIMKYTTMSWVHCPTQFPFKCFLDAYKGYNQIQMAKEDEEKTAFITSQGIFCYMKMPFGLRDAGATYQRLVDKVFHKQIGKNLEVYVDDLVIKSRTEEGMFLGYKVNSKGLKVCPDKVDAVLSLPSPKCQISREVTTLIAELLMLTAPMEKEELIVYLAAAKETVSAVLMTKREAKQMPIYFVSRALRGPELNYTSMEDGLLLVSRGIKRSSCMDGSGAGLILTNPEGIEFTYALRFRFDATNNKAEYEALIAGLRIAEQMGEADMIRYLEKVKALTGGFKAFTIKQIPRSENKKADALSKIASTSFAHLSKQVLVEELKEKSISEVEILTVVEEEGDTWMTPIYKYLAEETLPADMKKARAIRRKSWRFAVINGILYKKSFLGPWLSQNSQSKYTEALSKSEASKGRYWKSRSKGKKSRREEDDLSQPWTFKHLSSQTSHRQNIPETVMKYDSYHNVPQGESVQASIKRQKKKFRTMETIGDEEHSASAWMNFMVVRSLSPYNEIIGRPGVRKLQAVPSTAHKMLKNPVEGGVITLKSSKLVPLEYAVVSGPEETSSATKPIREERVKIAINPEYPEQTVMIGSTLTEKGHTKLCGLLQCNLDIFAWKPADMTGVPRHIAEHRLNIREGCSSVRQKKRRQAADRN